MKKTLLTSAAIALMLMAVSSGYSEEKKMKYMKSGMKRCPMMSAEMAELRAKMCEGKLTPEEQQQMCKMIKEIKCRRHDMKPDEKSKHEHEHHEKMKSH